MFRLDIKNFRRLSSVSIEETAKLMLFVGYNESGKSSLVEAIKFAITGSAYGLKGKDTKYLVTHGEKSLSVRLMVNGFQAARTTTSGDTLASVAARLGMDPALLPLAFDAKLCGDGGSKALGVFLSGAGASTFNPFTAFASDPVISTALEQCRRAGKLDSKSIISFATAQRAASKPPPEPVMPTRARPEPSEIARLEAAISGLAESIKEAAVEEAELRRVHATAAALVAYQRDVAAYRAAEASASADPLAGRRAGLETLQNCNVTTLGRLAAVLREAGRAELADRLAAVTEDIAAAVREAATLLSGSPAPGTLPPFPVPPPSIGALLETPPEEAIRRAVAAHAALNEASNIIADVEHEKTTLEQTLEGLNRDVGSWASYDTAMADHATNCARAEAEWNRWDDVAKRVAEAEQEHLNSVGDAFAKIVSEYSGVILQGRPLRIDRTEGIFLGPEPIALLSDSTAWRVEVAINAAIAHTLRSPLLLIDAADILDQENRALFTSFLLRNVAPHFAHVVVTMTARGDLRSEKAPDASSGVAKWVVSDGTVTKMV